MKRMSTIAFNYVIFGEENQTKTLSNVGKNMSFHLKPNS